MIESNDDFDQFPYAERWKSEKQRAHILNTRVYIYYKSNLLASKLWERKRKKGNTRTHNTLTGFFFSVFNIQYFTEPKATERFAACITTELL